MERRGQRDHSHSWLHPVWLGVVTAVAAGIFSNPTEVIARSALPLVDQVPRQHLADNAKRVIEALAFLGSPIREADRARFEMAGQLPDAEAIGAIQEILDQYCLVEVQINEEGWLAVRPASPDPKSRRLIQYEWRTFLVKVHNNGRLTTPLEVRSDQALLPDEITPRKSPSQASPRDPNAWRRWIGLKLYRDPPVPKILSGKELDYMILQVYSRDTGFREADLVFYLGGGAVSQGHYAGANLLFYVTSFDPADR